jgi:hypothetical protein
MDEWLKVFIFTYADITGVTNAVSESKQFTSPYIIDISGIAENSTQQ